MSNVSEELARLAELRDRGVLSEDEFQRQKAAVLGGGAPAPTAADEAATKKSNAAKGCGIIAAIILVLIVIGAIAGGGNDAATTGEDQAATQEASAAPPVEVTARQLFRAYQANEAGAQQQYGDRPLLVTGVVDGVDLDFSNEPVVKLQTDNQFMSAQADLVDADKPKASGLAKGSTIKLLCGNVGEVVGTPMLRECVIQ